MHLDRPMRRARPISLTPLVDIIFLLLLFFMLSSTFTKFGHLEIGAPAGAVGTGALPKALLTVSGESLRLNGDMIEMDALAGEGQRLVRETGADSLLVLIRGEGPTTQQLVQVLDTLKTVDGLTVTVAR